MKLCFCLWWKYFINRGSRFEDLFLNRKFILCFFFLWQFTDALLADLQNSVPGHKPNPLHTNKQNGSTAPGYGSLRARQSPQSVSCVILNQIRTYSNQFFSYFICSQHINPNKCQNLFLIRDRLQQNIAKTMALQVYRWHHRSKMVRIYRNWIHCCRTWAPLDMVPIWRRIVTNPFRQMF